MTPVHVAGTCSLTVCLDVLFGRQRGMNLCVCVARVWTDGMRFGSQQGGIAACGEDHARQAWEVLRSLY